MRRSILSLVVFVPLLGITWGHAPVHRRGHSGHPAVSITPQPLPPKAVLARYLGPFTMEGAWGFTSDDSHVFGYSGLVEGADGTMRAFNDAGYVLTFPAPGTSPAGPSPALTPTPLSSRAIRFKYRRGADNTGRDVESVAYDAGTRRYWVGVEGSNHIVRLNARLRESAYVVPKAMAGWGTNTGAEAMARLADGRFVAIREVTPSFLFEPRLHDAVLFAGDPTEHPDAAGFRFDGEDNFSVVDMAVLPDGRALILMRRLIWPLPMRFAGRIVIADTARVRAGQVWHSASLASLASVLPVDNFEAIAAVPQGDGRIAVWIMSDDNDMHVLQRTLLWKLSVDPARLPWPK